MTTRHIAVLQRPGDGPPFFTFPIEHSVDDHRSNYWHAQKYANGGFTGERCLVHRAGPYRGRPVFFRLADHEDRLAETVKAHEYLDFGCTREQRIEARFRLMSMNPGDNYLSLVFGSEGDVGVFPKEHRPAVIINSRDFDPVNKPYLPAEKTHRGLSLRISEPDIRRKPPGRIARAKASANYLESNLCKHRALQAGCDDGLLLDHTGECIAEASVSNLVLVYDDYLVTPWTDSAPLPGITLRTIRTIAEELKEWPTLEEPVPIPIGILPNIRAAFLTGTAVGVVRVRSIHHYDGRILWELDDPEAERLIADLTTIYWRVMYGEFPDYHPEWFTPIPEGILRQYNTQQSLFDPFSA